MSKYKCTKYEKEMLEMHSSGKSTAEIVKIFNTRFSNLGLTESYVRGAIKRYKGKQNENEQTTAKMFSENQERIQKKEKPAQKSHENQKTAEAQKNSEAKKMKESDKALIEAQIKSFSRLTKELRNTFVIFSAINEEFGKGSSRFFDFQCSAQKSVSIMAVVMNDHRLSDAHSECVKEALSEMEKFVSCRIRKGAFRNSEKLEVTGNLIAGLYDHNASRALDPQLHTHCVVANVTWCESEQRYKALSEYEVLKAIRYCGKFYQNAMAKRVQELGYDIELKRTNRGIEGFEIKGIDNDLLERYSRRRAEIEEEIEKFKNETGREPTPAEIHIIAKETREAKLTEITTPEVLESQRKMLSETELSHLRSIKYSALENERIIKQIPHGKIVRIFSKTIDHLYERKSVVVGHELLAEALNQGMKNARAEDLKQALENNKELIPLTESSDPLQTYYITKRGLALEHEAVQLANAGISIFKPLGEQAEVDTSKLSLIQRDAVNGILQCQDFACLLRGYAGSGNYRKFLLMERNL